MVNIRGILVTLVLLFTLSSVALLLWRKHTRRTAQIPAYLDSRWDILKEKRKSVRFKKRIPVTCSVAEESGNVHRLFSKNISGEGICLRVPEMLPEGSLVDLEVNIPNDRPMVVKGEVVWVKESQETSAPSERLFDTGIKFTRIEAKEKKRLRDFLVSDSKGKEG